MSVNRLSSATSPYLLQHAANPVDWYQWDTEALELARKSNKPILLSIGYSSCHWCHVMAHESFEDEATAQLMNSMFVNIKVDREERPDLDKIYQTAYQLMNQRGGGWPLTVFLTPDSHVPFFTGTYFPPVAAYGRASFREVLTAVDEAWRTREADIRQQNQAIVAAFDNLESAPASGELTAEPIARAFAAMQKSFDAPLGGFSQAPKFPHPDMLAQCLQHWYDSDEPARQQSALEMADISAKHMALGGMNDLVGGGFCRYSTDAQWMIPHFEKMLYDNGPLLGFYADLYRITGNSIYARTILETASWAQREMQSPEGGFYSSMDADSEGVEGKFYVWTVDAVRQLLSSEEYTLAAARFGLDQPANFEGHWHLHCDAQKFPEPLTAQQQDVWDSARDKLYQAREQRVHPGLDDKILTSWNALMIKGMVKAAKVADKPGWIDSAEKALLFIRQRLWSDGRLLAVHKDGVSHLNAYLDDYAYLIDAILELLSAKWHTAYLEFAMQLADGLLASYQDEERGGFFFTANEHETLIHRPKPYSDDAMPAGNGIAAKALIRLGYLTGRNDYLAAAERTLQSAWQDMQSYPHAHCSLLQALQEYLAAPETVIIRGEKTSLASWQKQLDKSYHPHRQVFAIPADEQDLPRALQDKQVLNQTCAYRCQGMTCFAPVMSLDGLL